VVSHQKMQKNIQGGLRAFLASSDQKRFFSVIQVYNSALIGSKFVTNSCLSPITL
jgi:hypothetical protein